MALADQSWFIGTSNEYCISYATCRSFDLYLMSDLHERKKKSPVHIFCMGWPTCTRFCVWVHLEKLSCIPQVGHCDLYIDLLESLFSLGVCPMLYGVCCQLLCGVFLVKSVYHTISRPPWPTCWLLTYVTKKYLKLSLASNFIAFTDQIQFLDTSSQERYYK